MQKSKLIKNSIAAIVQVIIVGIVYLVLYKYLLDTIGIKLLGVWSLIIATTSLALIANFGISTSIIKFVSTYHARQDFESLRKLVFTSSVFILITYLFIAALILFLGEYFLRYFIETAYIKIALEILPYSLICLIINALGGVVSGSLDGIQKNNLKSNIISFSAALLLGLSLLLTPKYGLKGLVFAQIIQALLVLIFTAYYLSKNIPGIFSLRWNWSRVIFKEIINYGLKMQALSFMQMSFEPVTKVFISKFGGLAMVGYYEMASRLVSQLRSLIVSANQVVIPVVAEAKENNNDFVKELYYKSFSIILFLNTGLTTLIILSAPFVSKIWIGEIVPVFIFSVILNSIAGFINISSNPAYFSYLGEGKLNWLMYSYLVITITNIVFGYFFGYYFGGLGVIVAWNLAFILGSLLILFTYHKSLKINLSKIVSGNQLLLILLSVLLCLSGCYSTVCFMNNSNNYLVLGLFLIVFFLFFILFVKNKNFLFLLKEIKRLLSNNKKLGI